jgi:adenosine deaminase
MMEGVDARPGVGGGSPPPDTWIRALPKAELHVHLDGSLRPGTMLELADAEGVALPSTDPEGLAQAMRADDATDLPSYLSRFALILSVLQREDALARVTRELVEDHAAEGVRLVEIRYAPVLNTEGGLSAEAVLEATLDGLRAGMEATGTHAGIIVCGIRSLAPSLSESMARLAVAYRDRGVVGFDLAGAEGGFPARDHAAAFRIAHEGLVPVTVHAGEGAGPESIRDALLDGRAQRIGHGTRLGEDPELLRWVRDRGIPLEVCITSNVQTRVARSLGEHPAAGYLRAGVEVVLCTDNRLVSGTTLPDEYGAAARELGLDRGELARVARAGFRAAFAPRSVRDRLMAQVDAFLEEAPGG